MGVDIDVYYGLGLLINSESVCKFEEKHKIENGKVRGCSHIVGENDRFCALCGKPKEIEIAVDFDFDEYIYSICIENGMRYGRNYQSNEAVIFYGKLWGDMDLKYGSAIKGIDLPKDLETINSMKSKMKELFDPLGLWDENNWKIWIFGNVC